MSYNFKWDDNLSLVFLPALYGSRIRIINYNSYKVLSFAFLLLAILSYYLNLFSFILDLILYSWSFIYIRIMVRRLSLKPRYGRRRRYGKYKRSCRYRGALCLCDSHLLIFRPHPQLKRRLVCFDTLISPPYLLCQDISLNLEYPLYLLYKRDLSYRPKTSLSKRFVRIIRSKQKGLFKEFKLVWTSIDNTLSTTH